MPATKKKDSKYDKLPICGKQPESEAEEKYLREIVKYEFYNLEQPGVVEQFIYGGAVNHQQFIFFHGQKYEIPRHVANWVESRGTPIYKWLPDGQGSMKKEQTGYTPRFSMRVVF